MLDLSLIFGVQSLGGVLTIELASDLGRNCLVWLEELVQEQVQLFVDLSDFSVQCLHVLLELNLSLLDLRKAKRVLEEYVIGLHL